MSTNRKKREHHWEYCDECEVWMVVCGTCGNNCCNGGYGEVDGKPCPDCESAYELQDLGKPESSTSKE
jgi:hypothetical protein